jgi:TRAP-type C4-dicarboxylate transport system substrate-binding protein
MRIGPLLASALAATLMASSALSAEITVRWGDVVGGTHPQVLMIDRVAEAVAKASDGRIEVQSSPGGRLGSSRDMIEAVGTGTQQIVTEGAANFGEWVPSISVVEAPYVWSSPEHLVKVLNGPMLEEINAKLTPVGMRALAALYYGTRHVTTRDKAVMTPADESFA